MVTRAGVVALVSVPGGDSCALGAVAEAAQATPRTSVMSVLEICGARTPHLRSWRRDLQTCCQERRAAWGAMAHSPTLLHQLLARRKKQITRAEHTPTVRVPQAHRDASARG